MNQIKNINIITKKINNWKISDIAYIKEFTLFSDFNMKKNSLIVTFLSQSRELVLGWPDMEKEFNEIKLLFKDISNLKLNFEGQFIPQLTGFDIIDISSNNWEGINFQVEDYENGKIKFYCKDIEALPISE